jgi:hypothetical protein
MDQYQPFARGALLEISVTAKLPLGVKPILPDWPVDRNGKRLASVVASYKIDERLFYVCRSLE